MSLKELLDQASKIVVLTGAGVSTDSGIPDFKSTDEDWPYEEPREQLISRFYFQRNPTRFWKIYREVFGSKFEAVPNNVHRWIASLESTKDVTVVTQNVDGLHQLAGSTRVIEAHGALKTAICMKCRETVAMETVADEALPRCRRDRKPLKPSVSLFGEGVHGMGEARNAILESDLLLVMGTSLFVGPFNELPYNAIYATEQPTLFVNRDLPPESYEFSHLYTGELSDFIAAMGA